MTKGRNHKEWSTIENIKFEGVIEAKSIVDLVTKHGRVILESYAKHFDIALVSIDVGEDIPLLEKDEESILQYSAKQLLRRLWRIYACLNVLAKKMRTTDINSRLMLTVCNDISLLPLISAGGATIECFKSSVDVFEEHIKGRVDAKDASLNDIMADMNKAIEETLLNLERSAKDNMKGVKEIKKRFNQEPDEKRDRLFRCATRLYYEEAKRTNLKRGISYEKALKDANENDSIYDENEFDLDFGTIAQHYRTWRNRNRQARREIENECYTGVTKKDTP